MTNRSGQPLPWWTRTWICLGGGLLVCSVVSSCSAFRSPPRPSPDGARRASAAGPYSPGGGATDSNHAEAIAAILAAHNAERSRRGSRPLEVNEQLAQAAQSHANDMARREKMTHRGGDGSSPFDRIRRAGFSFQAAAENVAFGYDQVDTLMTGWMRSAGHRRNILGLYDEIGVGRSIAASGLPYYCVTFGTPAAR